MSRPLSVDIWSDVVCPWCYIGKRRFEAGLEAFSREADVPPVEVEYRSFELMPGTPADVDATAAAFLASHLGVPEAQARQMQEQVAAVAASVGLRYDFSTLRPANTVKAHQVLHLARVHGVQAEMNERLLRGHFTEGRHVGRDDELADLAADVGLDRDVVRDVLRRDAYLPAVREDQRRAREVGVRGVPFFVVDGRYGVSGAQAPEQFTRVLQQAAEDRAQGSAA